MTTTFQLTILSFLQDQTKTAAANVMFAAHEIARKLSDVMTYAERLGKGLTQAHKENTELREAVVEKVKKQFFFSPDFFKVYHLSADGKYRCLKVGASVDTNTFEGVEFDKWENVEAVMPLETSFYNLARRMDLDGSPKQIDWAVSIIEKKYFEMRALEAKIAKISSERLKERFIGTLQTLKSLPSTCGTSASAWIDAR